MPNWPLGHALRALFQFVHVVQDASRHADGQDGESADGFVLDAAGNVHDHAAVQLDLLVVQDHRPLAVDDVVELVRLLVVMQLGVVDFDVVHFARRGVLLRDEAADGAARLRPRFDVRGVRRRNFVCTGFVCAGIAGSLSRGEETRVVSRYSIRENRRQRAAICRDLASGRRRFRHATLHAGIIGLR